MEITRIKLLYKDKENLKALYTISFNNCFTVFLGSIFYTQDEGLNAYYPELYEDEKAIARAYPIPREFRDLVKNLLVYMYNNRIDEFIKVGSSDTCEISRIDGKALNYDKGLFEVDLVLNSCFRINKIPVQRKDDGSVIMLPIVNHENFLQVSFLDKQFERVLIDEITKWININYPTKRFATPDYKTPEERREKSNSFIKSMGIVCYENLRVREDSRNVRIKNIDVICKKAIATLIITQIGEDIAKNDYQGSMNFFAKYIEKFGVKDYFNSKEKRILDGSYSKQDVIDVDWEYEIYWAIVWALGLIENDISDACSLCNCDRAVALVRDVGSFEEFRSRCKIRSIEEILDMIDLYFRYDWAVTEKRIKPDTLIGSLKPSNVVERRRGLEWIISDVDDWYDLSLNT